MQWKWKLYKVYSNFESVRNLFSERGITIAIMVCSFILKSGIGLLNVYIEPNWYVGTWRITRNRNILCNAKLSSPKGLTQVWICIIELYWPSGRGGGTWIFDRTVISILHIIGTYWSCVNGFPNQFLNSENSQACDKTSRKQKYLTLTRDASRQVWETITQTNDSYCIYIF